MGNLINRIINKILIVEDGYKIDLKDYNENLELEEYVMTLLSQGELELMREKNNNEINKIKYEILKYRIGAENVYVYGVKNLENHILGYFCLAYEDREECGINYTISIGDKGAYLFDDHVFINSRGKGVQKYAIDKRLKIAIDDGREYAIVNIYSWNISAIKNCRQLGFKKYIRYYYLKFIKKIIIK